VLDLENFLSESFFIDEKNDTASACGYVWKIVFSRLVFEISHLSSPVSS